MYRIYFDRNKVSSTSMRSSVFQNPVVKLVEGAAGTFEFTILPDHTFYDYPIEKNTQVTVFRAHNEVFDSQAEPLFSGFVDKVEESLFKTKKVTCVGELTMLNDVILRPKRYEGYTPKQLLTDYISKYNAQVSYDRQFTVGTVEAVDSNNSITCYTNYNPVMQEIKEDLLDDLGGYLRCRHVNEVRYLDYLVEPVRDNGQIIKIGRNLLDFSRTISVGDLCTRVIPRGANLAEEDKDPNYPTGLEQRVSIESVNSGKDYIDSTEAQSIYGVIEKVVTFDNVTTPSALLTKGREWLNSYQYADLELEIKAVDLNMTDPLIDRFELSDNIRVYSPPHGLDEWFRLTQMQIHLNEPSKDAIVLGKSKTKTLSSSVSNTAATVKREISKESGTSGGGGTSVVETIPSAEEVGYTQTTQINGRAITFSNNFVNGTCTGNTSSSTTNTNTTSNCGVFDFSSMKSYTGGLYKIPKQQNSAYYYLHFKCPDGITRYIYRGLMSPYCMIATRSFSETVDGTSHAFYIWNIAFWAFGYNKGRFHDAISFVWDKTTSTLEIIKDGSFNATEILSATKAIYDKIATIGGGSGGGSTVSVSNLATTGTTIAKITIDGVAYDIKAPTSTSNLTAMEGVSF